MRWMRRKRKPPTPEQIDAKRAVVHAELQLRNAQKSHTEAVDLAKTLREIRETNHFGQSLERAFGARP